MLTLKRIGLGVASVLLIGSVVYGQGEQRRGRAGRPGGRGHPLMQKLQEIDANADGKLSRDEWLDLFLKLDKNGDEYLTMQEVMSAFGGPGRGRGKFGERLKQMDKNGDGAISREEFEGPPQFFDRLDRDGDGQISAEEMKAIAERFGQGGQGAPGGKALRMDQDGDGKISREEFRGPEQMFDKLDTDGDGFLTMEELRKAREMRKRREE